MRDPYRRLGFLLIALLLIGCQRTTTAPSETAVSEVKDLSTEPIIIVPGETSTPTENIVHLPLAANESAADPVTPASTTQPTAHPIAIESPKVTPRDTETPGYPIYQGPAIDREDIGVQIHLHREDLNLILAQLKTLDVGWVKVQVSWKIYQPGPDRLDDYRFGELDRLVEAASESDIDVLLSVAKAPEWSRPTTELDGPPADYGRFESFMHLLASRYKGSVAAYELWNEPNLQREWNGFPLSAIDLVVLVRAGASGVKAADPEAMVISGAPAATGINDGIVAIDDRIYLQQMIDAGVTGVVDAIGVHPYGWANPPESSVAAPDPVVPSHNDHPSFFFRDTLSDYRSFLDKSGNPDLPLWVTEFGWGSFEGLGGSPPDEVAFMNAVNEKQQADYTLRAIELASQWPGIGPLIIWNLNFAPRFGNAFAESGFSLISVDGSPRPVYHSLTTIPKLPE